MRVMIIRKGSYTGFYTRGGRYLIIYDIPVKILPTIRISLPAIISLVVDIFQCGATSRKADVKLRRSISLNDDLELLL